jgi:hypothetical protein
LRDHWVLCQHIYHSHSRQEPCGVNQSIENTTTGM